MGELLRFIRLGDWLILLVAALLGTGALVLLVFSGGMATKAVVRRDGTVVAELPLQEARRIQVEGPLGATVIEVQPGHARVVADPSHLQYCVRQGWLTQAHPITICAPNPGHGNFAY